LKIRQEVHANDHIVEQRDHTVVRVAAHVAVHVTVDHTAEVTHVVVLKNQNVTAEKLREVVLVVARRVDQEVLIVNQDPEVAHTREDQEAMRKIEAEVEVGIVNRNLSLRIVADQNHRPTERVAADQYRRE